ncbi:MarR family winged helix-turn-helix transcriptional regulator [Bradyrhizobium cytisi]|uniref:MarR family transcriptional regulator n=1 Tax=Bradyrhizobium cytisi TaxID=515489 RepID=A0A5S4VVT7_9BRAD|nr:MarR family transcriptional regulator [Bradyrhizobium cytisi]TYL72076.1 MarR family transcriptional regulator [Bradyrhizobium cytisi]
MPLAREAVELLIQASRVWYFEGNQHGLRDREWMALRFLGRANRFSRNPSAVAGFISATRATASQIVKTLEGKSFLVRKPSQRDKRSVVLHVTAQGEKCLNQYDPVNRVLNAVTALGPDECVRLRDLLQEILNHLDEARQRLDAGVCRNCMFLAERRPSTGKRRATAEFLCRLYRAPVSLEETELLCTNFERTRDRPKLEEDFDRARVASQE